MIESENLFESGEDITTEAEARADIERLMSELRQSIDQNHLNQLAQFKATYEGIQKAFYGYSMKARLGSGVQSALDN